MTSREGGRRLHLVRHGKPLVLPEIAPSRWLLDPSSLGDIDVLRSSGRLPTRAAWFSSPEPKAVETARRLTDAQITVVDDLREHERGPTPWFDDLGEWHAVVRGVFAKPDEPALPGWEPLRRTSARVLSAVHRILADRTEDDLVLVGHGTAWTALKAGLLVAEPDLDAWDRLEMPDVWVVDL